MITGQQATGVVNVIKLQLDVNHDGHMDLSFAGPDNTSQARPLLMWINNDNDYSSFAGDIGQDQPVRPGWDNTINYLNWQIPCVRDLEDWARLWICGVPALTNGGYQVTLSWANVNRGSPAINLVNAVETNGGTLYLSDPDTAAAQVVGGSGGPGNKYPTVSVTGSLTLPANLFTEQREQVFPL